MYNTLHVFGDSFSAGVGVDIEQGLLPHVSKGYRKYSNTAFYNNIPANKITNYAVPGNSNEFILLCLTKAINNIKKGDIVVLGLTEWARVTVPLKRSKKDNLNLNLTGGFFIEHLQSHRLEYVEYLKRETDLTTSEVNAAFKFYELLTFPKRRSDLRRDYYLDSVSHFGKYLTNKGVKFIMWDYTLWEMFENLLDWSKGEYEDGHWSPNGHMSFLGYLLWGLDNNITYLNASNYMLNKSKVYKYEYINPPNSDIVI